jgi:MFS superfamily sulfate permease-like transporter
VTDLSKKIRLAGSFLVELVVYASFVTGYFLLVLHFMGGWIDHIFESDKLLYAVLAVALITVQGAVLERVTTGLMWLIGRLQAITPVLFRLSRPHETIIRPEQVPGLLVYRFAGPLFFFNSAYFGARVREIIKSEKSPVKFFLINAEAMVDIDTSGIDTLDRLHKELKEEDILLGIIEAKGHFSDKLLSTRMTTRKGFNHYPDLITAVKELKKEKAAKKEKKSKDSTSGS